jgi:hypothetical protein
MKGEIIMNKATAEVVSKAIEVLGNLIGRWLGNEKHNKE